MFRAVAFATALFVSVASLRAQEAVPAPGAGMTPPVAPTVPGAPILPVAPPLPGQLQASPGLAPAPSIQEALPVGTLPEAPPSITAPTPSVPLSKSKPGSSTSSTGQFIIHGDDLTVRSALSSKCEDIAADLRILLKDKQPWVLPIVVLMNSGEAARKADQPVSTTISQLAHGGFHIQVNVNMRPDLRPEDLRKELVRALLAERILRDQKEIVTKRTLLLPDWLFLGILEAGEYRQRARPSALFAAIFKSGKIFGIEEIIEAPASAIEDALSRTIYQTSCCALVLALLDQPDGGLRMGKFLNALATDPRTERELLNQWFPNFAASDASLNKWWALQLATLASPGVSEPLSPEDTLAALEDALILRFQAKPSELPQTSRHTPVALKPEPAPTRPVPAPAALHTPREPKPVEKPTEPEPAPAMEASAEEKRGFFGRLNPFAKPKSSDDEITEAIEAAAKAEAESAMPPVALEDTPPLGVSDLPPETPSSSKKDPTPLLNRWFGEGKKEASAPEPATAPEAEEKVKPQPKPEPKAPAKPAVPAKPTPEPEPAPSEPEAEKKPSNLNPMNWFRGGKKEKEKDNKETPTDAPVLDEAEAPTKKAALSRELQSIEAQLRAGTPLIAMVYQEVAVEVEEKASEKKRFFGLFGKKKPESDPAEPEAPKKPEPEPKAEPKKPKEAPAPAPEAPQPTTPSEEAMPAPEEESEAKPDKAKRPMLRLHLFGGDKKEATEELPTEGATEAPMPAPEPVTAPKVTETAPRPKPKPTPPPASKSSPKNETAVAAGIPIEDYVAVIKRKDFSTIIQRNVNALGALQTRAAVLFRPIVSDYILVLEDLNKGKTKGMDARLKTLRTRSQVALTKSNAVRDLLDLHEANDTPAMSGLFEDYLKLPETIQNELPERTDAISKYLDALDKEFSKK